jgi:hypothetical protein
VKDNSTPLSPADAKEIVDSPDDYDDAVYAEAIAVLEAAGWE